MICGSPLTFSRMDEDDKTRRDIENILNNTVNILDLRTPIPRLSVCIAAGGFRLYRRGAVFGNGGLFGCDRHLHRSHAHRRGLVVDGRAGREKRSAEALPPC